MTCAPPLALAPNRRPVLQAAVQAGALTNADLTGGMAGFAGELHLLADDLPKVGRALCEAAAAIVLALVLALLAPCPHGTAPAASWCALAPLPPPSLQAPQIVSQFFGEFVAEGRVSLKSLLQPVLDAPPESGEACCCTGTPCNGGPSFVAWPAAAAWHVTHCYSYTRARALTTPPLPLATEDAKGEPPLVERGQAQVLVFGILRRCVRGARLRGWWARA